ncbi:YggS family pyridoxal phosphate-dependent enzyme [Bacteroidales bacterium OttesenSCG-928-A17]|nr:YggS family pyridoxal phosphate-dependent enzyme [Bacteroidales bacterium OttesenSCG-928-A17]
MEIASNLSKINSQLPSQTRLTAVSKFHSEDVILEAYEAGQRIFGESRVQELVEKYDHLPKDIEWHFIGHLQTNKVKYIAPFIHMVQSVDSLKLLAEINRQAGLFRRRIPVLLQIHIAQEEHKFGFSFDEIEAFLKTTDWESDYPHVCISGLMGMATFTDDQQQIALEFDSLAQLFHHLKSTYFINEEDFKELSMGMSDDYPIAIEKGSTLIRVGSKIFGNRTVSTPQG